MEQSLVLTTPTLLSKHHTSIDDYVLFNVYTYYYSSSISVYTVQHAIDTLDALGTSGMPLDTSLINNTALSAQEIAQNAIKQLATINSTQLGGVVSIVLLSARQLSEIASTVSSMAISKLFIVLLYIVLCCYGYRYPGNSECF